MTVNRNLIFETIYSKFKALKNYEIILSQFNIEFINEEGADEGYYSLNKKINK